MLENTDRPRKLSTLEFLRSLDSVHLATKYKRLCNVQFCALADLAITFQKSSKPELVGKSATSLRVLNQLLLLKGTKRGRSWE